MSKKFDVVAASHGASGLALIAIFGSAGIIVLFDLRSNVAVAIALLVVALSYACGMLFFGFRARINRD